jgi:hypothetical protein
MTRAWAAGARCGILQARPQLLAEIGFTVSESASADVLQTLKTEYRTRVMRPGSWVEDELRQLLCAVEDLARFLGGPAAYRRKLGRVFLWRTSRRTSMAAMAVPVIDVVYFQGASWGDPPEFKWQTVHELAHVWDIRSFYRLSRGLVRATGSSYGGFRRQLPIPFEYEAGGQWLEGRKPPLNGLEDWADSVATYVYPDQAESRRPAPRLISPLRWDYVRQQMQVRAAYPSDWLGHFCAPQGGDRPPV